MLLLEPDRPVVTSPSDLRAAAVCEFGLLRSFDALLGRAEEVRAEADPVLARAAALGDAHEQRVLRSLREQGLRVVGLGRPAEPTRAAYEKVARDTLAHLSSGADVVYQATFFDGTFLGFADFLVRDRETGRWAVWDTKLARSAGVAALLQIAAYAEELRLRGVPTAPVARLVLGDRSEEDFALDDLVPVYRERRARLEGILAEHRADAGPAEWDDERWLACGRCDECAAAIAQRRDVLLVAGVHTSQRKRLAAAGVHTVEQLSGLDAEVPGMSARVRDRLAAQAALQLRQEADGTVHYDVFDPAALRVLPPPSPGDIFFDFEGDPLWSDRGDPDWGLEYLFGVVDLDASGEPAYRAFWAHDRAQERQALLDFLAFVRDRRAAYPDLHIYHYADYERSALLRLAARHGVGEDDVDDLLRDGVLVDLYAVVRSAVRVSQPSYSIKKLEPLYMGDDLRDGEVTTAGDSIVVYHEVTDAVVDGRVDAAAALLEEIRAYNDYDCRSTLRLRDWLVDRATEHGVERAGCVEPADAAGSAPPPQAPPVEAALRARVPDVPVLERTRDEWALALLAAVVQYNRREQKPFWWGHFDRLRSPRDEWVKAGDVFPVESGRVLEDWTTVGRKAPRRRLALTGVSGDSAPLPVGASVQTVYDEPVPDGVTVLPGHVRAVGGGSVTVVERLVEPDGEVLVVEEALRRGVAPHTLIPAALTPVSPPRTASIDTALETLALEVDRAGGRFPDQAGLDLLRRRPPRTRGGRLPRLGMGPDRFVDAVTAAVLDLDRSYLGVQGPPGTGKTHLASRVVTRLVRDHGWKVGVVAQSHAVVENLLAGLVSAGLPGELVGKKADAARAEAGGWVALADFGHAAFCAERADTGYVVGGTAWDLTNPKRIEPGQLDLVVVDEAGQLSLATTLACSTAGDRLLLLGDPQQLPQVSQGHHPEPVDDSALGWLLTDDALRQADVIPSEVGYFLDTTWRMHPALTERVSRLSYAGALRSAETVTMARHLEGVEPGLHVELVDHHDNTTESPEEAERVVELVRDLVGRTWTDPSECPDPVVGSMAEPGGDRTAGSGAGPGADSAVGSLGRSLGPDDRPDSAVGPPGPDHRADSAAGPPGSDGRADSAVGSPGSDDRANSAVGSLGRPLGPGDILVVSPYNAQVNRIREALGAAGFAEVAVGTVDAFQGREAPVAILSMAASAGADISRGIGFLLERNRLNVSISRAKLAAYLVRSRVLTDFSPRSPRELLALGAFIGLCAPDGEHSALPGGPVPSGASPLAPPPASPVIPPPSTGRVPIGIPRSP